MSNRDSQSFPIFKLIAVLVSIGVLVFFSSNLWVNQSANEIIVKQGAVDGKLTVWTEAGVHFLNFGTATRYHRSFLYSFSAAKDQGSPQDQSVKVRFNDGGHGNVSGTVQVYFPADPIHVRDMHVTFHSEDAVIQNLIRPALERALYMTGPLMSSKESAAERRADLMNMFEDQMAHGIYRTFTHDIKIMDPVTDKEKTVSKVELLLDDKKSPIRQEGSPLDRFGVRVDMPNINGVKYDDAVEKQISDQQGLIMKVQTAIAQSKEAEQRAMTAAKEGEANAAKAKWEVEVTKAKAVTQAEADKAVALTQATKAKEVAELDVQTAQLKKQEQTLLGQGEASRARAMMEANGYFPERLDAYTKVALANAEAYAKQRPTPDIMFSSGSSNMSSAEQNLAMSNAFFAKQLGVGIPGVNMTAAKK